MYYGDKIAPMLK